MGQLNDKKYSMEVHFQQHFLQNNMQIKQDKSETKVKNWCFSLGSVVEHKYCVQQLFFPFEFVELVCCYWNRA